MTTIVSRGLLHHVGYMERYRQPIHSVSNQYRSFWSRNTTPSPPPVQKEDPWEIGTPSSPSSSPSSVQKDDAWEIGTPATPSSSSTAPVINEDFVSEHQSSELHLAQNIEIEKSVDEKFAQYLQSIERATEVEVSASTPVVEHTFLWKPVDLTQDFLSIIHTQVVPDWVWVAIAVPWIFKCVQIPLSVRVQRQVWKNEPLIHELQEEAKSLQMRFSHDEERMKKELKALFAKRGNPTFMLLAPMKVPLIFLPLQMSNFMAFRTMHERFPSWHHEGWWWFPDLSASDASFVLPCSVGFLTAGHMIVSSQIIPDPKQAEMLKYFGIVMGGLSVPIMGQFGVGFNIYCLSNIISSMAQSGLLRHPTFRKKAGLKPLVLPNMTDEEKVKDKVLRLSMCLQIVAVGLILYTCKDVLTEKTKKTPSPPVVKNNEME